MTTRAPADDDRDDEAGLRVGPRKQVAAGVPGVLASLRHARAQLGLARSAKTLLKLNQPDGFDCPGCAWPDPADTTPLRVLRERGQGRRRGGHGPPRRRRPSSPRTRSTTWPGAPTTGSASRAGSPSRCTGRRASDHYRPIGWDDAFGVIADALARDVATRTGPSSTPRAAPATRPRSSTSCSCGGYGTNNLPDCSNMCHESSGVALDADHRHRQGHRHPRRHRRGRPDPRGRPEPGHQPPAHAQRARAGQAATARRSWPSTRCPRPG